MIPAEHTGLWEKIKNFPLDEPGYAFTFSQKLAAEQKWSPVYTEKVIEEYRRFIFLCCISPIGASPSKDVDEAWHLHLTYTKSYWIDFCKNTLGKDIHHHPSKGGVQEKEKHENWYKDTITFYESVFGHTPPKDIWPGQTKGRKIVARVPRIQLKKSGYALAALVLLIPFMLNVVFYGQVNPFALSGPHFLAFFFYFALAVILAFIFIQQNRDKQLQNLADRKLPADVTLFQLSFYLDGKHKALQTAIVDLVRRNLLEVTTDKKFIVHQHNYIQQYPEQNPLVESLFREKENEVVNYEIMAVQWFDDEKFRHPYLNNLLGQVDRKYSFGHKYHVLLLGIVVGLIRIVQGLTYDKPVALLVFELFFYGCAAMLVANFFSIEYLLLKKLRNRVQQPEIEKQLYTDPVVSEYAMHGNSALGWVTGGLLLSTLFAATPASRPDIKNWNKGTDGGSSCGSSCGGGSGGGCGGCGGD